MRDAAAVSRQMTEPAQRERAVRYLLQSSRGQVEWEQRCRRRAVRSDERDRVIVVADCALAAEESVADDG